MSRPEDTLSADVYYDSIESRKYTTSSRIQNIQASMTQRALELLDLKTPSFILDIGCGSGLSGEIISSVETEYGGPHVWTGIDVSADMLSIALERDSEGDLILGDMGQGLPFRAGTFDAAISISAIQWLCSAESSNTSPQGRLSRFFSSLYASLRRGGRAVCQFYPKNDEQRRMITQAAIKAGFRAGLLEDDPDTKNVKLYLVLTVGGTAEDGNAGDITNVVHGMDNVDILDVRRGVQQAKRSGKREIGAMGESRRAYIMRKKERAERQGKVVKQTTKYTGRKRRIQF